MASNQDDAGSTPAWRSILEGTKRHDTEAQTKREERVVNCLWGVMEACRTFNPFGRGSIPRRGTRLLSFNGIGHRPSKPRIWVQIPAGAPYSRGPRDGHPTTNRVYAGWTPAGSAMALWPKGVGARFLIEIMRVRIAPGLPVSLRDRLTGRTAGFEPANLGSNPSPSTNFVQVSGVNG